MTTLRPAWVKMGNNGAMPVSTTQLLIDWGKGNPAALDELAPHLYRELHRLARSYLKRERPNHTLQPTALINEMYIRLIGQSQAVQFENRAHFFGIAARLMRRILVDHAREHRAKKRGGDVSLVSLDESPALSPPDILEIDEALRRLAQVDERKARVIEMRYFGGMSRQEIAQVAGLTVATVKRDLRLGETWLQRHLQGAK